MNKYKTKQSNILSAVEDIKKQVFGGRRIIKYINNTKSLDQLQIPRYQSIGQIIEQENKVKALQQLNHNNFEIMTQSIFEGPASEVEVPALGKFSERPTQIQQTRIKQPFDISQFKGFLEFQAEKQISRKKSKYETIINRLKLRSQQINSTAGHINIPILLQSMTPSFEKYREQQQQLLQFDNTNELITVPESKNNTLPQMVKKFGLQSKREKKDAFMAKIVRLSGGKQPYLEPHLKPEESIETIPFIQSSVVHTDDRKSHLEIKFDPHKSSLAALRTQKVLFESYLKQSQFKSPIKYQVKDFYDQVCQYSQLSQQDHRHSQRQLVSEMGLIRQHLTEWQQKMLTQNEIMEQNLVADIKDSVIKNKRKMTAS